MEKIGFGTDPKLRKLILKNLPKLSNIWSNVDENASKTCLLSSSTFKNFHNLVELDITDYGMEEDERDYLLKRLDFFFPSLFLKFSLYYFLSVLLK